ncbi:MAG: OmpA family protein [Elusimicrobia bacterium]|nr:OmpA family protein [Elusimicrobiota bacterium]
MPVYRIRRDELENQLNKSALWAVTYGDLMSYLMILFLVLFSFSLVKSDRAKSRKYEESLSSIQKVFGGEESKERLARVKAMECEDTVVSGLQKSLETNALKNLVKMELNESRVKLILSEAIIFDSGKADLKETAKNVLTPIIEELKKVPNGIIVEGHTDMLQIKSGKYKNNWELSMARAYAVIEFMENAGIDSKRLAGIGYGPNRPVEDNSTPEGRTKNRRIEISLIKTQ